MSLKISEMNLESVTDGEEERLIIDAIIGVSICKSGTGTRDFPLVLLIGS
jgi:NAD(P)H-hydrate repair Nnr-like enzyme with NAD(P)H-hydrate epimerase domain